MPVTLTRADALTATGCPALAAALADVPFPDADALVDAARAAWWGEGVGVPDWLAAFASHPRIGSRADVAAVGGAAGALAAGEQAGAATAGEDVLQQLAAWNARYEARFGHVYIVCAAGRSGESMLEELKRRYTNPPYAELAVAAAEQMKIAERRLRALAGPAEPAASAASRAAAVASHLNAPPPARAAITTHVLDVSVGAPAPGVGVTLARRPPGAPAAARVWAPVAARATDADGRVGDLLPPGAPVEPGVYRLEFDTGAYFDVAAAAAPGYGGGAAAAFFPTAAVEFRVDGAGAGGRAHYHVPLTWSPFGYSTYRGS